MTKEQALALVVKYGTKRAAARAAKIAESTFRRILAGKSQGEKKNGETVPSLGTMSLSEVIKPHDLVDKAMKILATIPAGRLMKDDVLRREIGIGQSRWRSVRGSTRLAGHWHLMPDKTFMWGAKAMIVELDKRMKELP